MKHLTFIIVFLFIFFNEIKSQDIFSSTPINDVPPSAMVGGVYPETNSIMLGGQEKTASGVLRVLVIFVRYKDDTVNTANYQIIMFCQLGLKHLLTNRFLQMAFIRQKI